MASLPSVRFVFDRKHTATKKGVKNAKKALVQIEVLHQRRRKYFSTGIKLYADQWVANKEVHVVNSAYAREYNTRLQAALREMMERIERETARGTFSLDALTAEDPMAMTVKQLADEFVASKRGRAEATVRTYVSFNRTLEEYFGDRPISGITAEDIERFDKARLDSGKKPVGRRNLLMHLRKIFAYAVKSGYVDSNPAQDVEMPSRRSGERVRLTESEVALIAGAELPGELVMWRDLFLFQCYTGMAYADLMSLTEEMITEEDGRWFIDRARHKTGVRYRIMLLQPALDVLRRYGFRLPAIEPTAETYDRQLTRIEKLVGLKKHISSHVGRHTFATWALSKGVPIEIVSKMLGHTNIQTTQIYAKILAKDVEQQFLRLDDLLD